MIKRTKVRVQVVLTAELEVDYDTDDFEASRFGKSLFSQALDRYLEEQIEQGAFELPEWTNADGPYELDHIEVSR